MDGKYKYGLEGEGTLGGDVKPGRIDATGQKHRPQIEVGRDAVEIEDFPCFLQIENFEYCAHPSSSSSSSVSITIG